MNKTIKGGWGRGGRRDLNNSIFKVFKSSNGQGVAQGVEDVVISN